MGVLAHLDPFRGESPSPARGFLQLTGLGLFFYGLLYLLPAIFSAPFADHDLYLAQVEVYRRQWLIHGHPLESSWIFGAGSQFQGLAQLPPGSPAVLLSLLLGTVAGTFLVTWLQLGLGCGFAYGLARSWSCSHRGAAIAAIGLWFSPWMTRHLSDGHLPWPALAWCIALAWLLSSTRRFSPLQLFLGVAACTALLLACSPFQAPIYGAPLVGLALIRSCRALGLAAGVRFLVAIGLGMGMASLPFLSTWAAALEAFDLYGRGDLMALQEIKFGTSLPRPLQTLLGIFLPYASYAWHAEGNLVVLLPLLLACPLLPARPLLMAMGGCLVLGLLPDFGPIRQFDRCLWVFLALVAIHCGRHEEKISNRRLRLSLGVAMALGAGVMGIRWVMQPLSPLDRFEAPAAIVGLATPGRERVTHEEYPQGIFRTIRQGLVLVRPYSHVLLPPAPPDRPRGFLRSGEVRTLLVEEGHLRAQGPFDGHQSFVVGLRYSDALVGGLVSEPAARFGDQEGWLSITPPATEAIEVWSR